ncbi:MAG: HIT family protein [Planctomycetota bacterium]|jgi:ATP adenylyltransferase
MNHENLWAPWRLAYLADLARRAEQDGWSEASDGSFLVDYWNAPDRDEPNHVIHRDEHGMILLNRYPYANGHLLIALGDARPRLLDYEPAQRAALWNLVERAIDLMQRALSPQGINMGINEGRAAGAGVPEHLHAHVVPRWSGDTNFITVVGNIRVVPSALEDMAKLYRETVGSTP